jgi:hypothetical protein
MSLVQGFGLDLGEVAARKQKARKQSFDAKILALLTVVGKLEPLADHQHDQESPWIYTTSKTSTEFGLACSCRPGDASIDFYSCWSWLPISRNRICQLWKRRPDDGPLSPSRNTCKFSNPRGEAFLVRCRRILAQRHYRLHRYLCVLLSRVVPCVLDGNILCVHDTDSACQCSFCDISHPL